MKKKITEAHIKKVTLIEQYARENRSDSQGIVMSCTRDFRNYPAAISSIALLKKKF